MAPQRTSRARSLKDNTIVIGWQFDDLAELQSACLARFDCVFGRHSQLCRRTSWFSKNGRLVPRTFMPIDDCKPAICFQRRSHSLRKPSAVRNAMKGIRHENEVCRSSQLRNVVSITRDKLTVNYSAFHEPMPRNFQQCRINVDCQNVPRDFCYLKGEPTVARA